LLARRHGASTILIEMAGPGLNLIQDLRADTNMDVVRPIGVKPDGSKRDRMAIQSAKIEAGQVHLPRNAPWLGDFLHELLAFPNARHDDQVDSVSQFLRWAQTSAQSDPVKIDVISIPGDPWPSFAG
jgi:predicted phage terminase large subunit-like protein